MLGTTLTHMMGKTAKQGGSNEARNSAVAALAFIAATVIAQTPPSFAGKWTLVADPNAAPAGGGRGGMGGLGQEATIVQDAGSLTITRTTPVGTFTSTYKLDGSESKNTPT